jgi:sec-independent protein translocase protein TatA
MIANILGSDGLIVLMVAVVVLFGGSQLPKLAKNVGSAGREFRKAQQEAEMGLSQASPVEPSPVAIVASPQAAAAAGDEVMLVGRSELRQELTALLQEREQQSPR